MPTTDDHGMPIYSGTEPMPGWAVAHNAQSAALGEALVDAAQADKDNDSVETIADIPVTGNWPGRQLMVEENDMVYMHDGTGFYVIGGKRPYYFGSRSNSAVGTGSSAQEYITATDYARGVTMTGGVLTFATEGIYQVDQAVIWEANGAGQRNLGIEGTDIIILGPAENDVMPSATVVESQHLTTYILVTAPGATAMPYVTHNTGVALDVKGSVCVMWVSA